MEGFGLIYLFVLFWCAKQYWCKLRVASLGKQMQACHCITWSRETLGLFEIRLSRYHWCVCFYFPAFLCVFPWVENIQIGILTLLLSLQNLFYPWCTTKHGKWSLVRWLMLHPLPVTLHCAHLPPAVVLLGFKPHKWGLHHYQAARKALL